MRKAKVAVFVLIAAIAGGVLIRRLCQTEESKIRKRVSALRERVSKTTGESAAVMALKMQTFGELLDDPCEVELQEFPGNGVYTRAEISSRFARIRPRFSALQLTFHDLSIRLRGSDAAEATFTARVVADTRDGENYSGAREIVCRLHKCDGAWFFARFEEVQVLRP